MTSESAAQRVCNTPELFIAIWEHAILTYRDGRHIFAAQPGQGGAAPITDGWDGTWHPWENKHAWLVECLLLCRAWRAELDRLRWRCLELQLACSSLHAGPLGKLMSDRSLGSRVRTLIVGERHGSIGICSVDVVRLAGEEALDLGMVDTAVIQDRLRFLQRSCPNIGSLEIQWEWFRGYYDYHRCLERPTAWAGVPDFMSLTVLRLGWSDEVILRAILRRTPNLKALYLRAHALPRPAGAAPYAPEPVWPRLRVLHCFANTSEDDGEIHPDLWDDADWLQFGTSLSWLLDATGQDLRDLKLQNIRPEIVLQVLGGQSLPHLDVLFVEAYKTRLSDRTLWADALTLNPAAVVSRVPLPLDFFALYIDIGPERWSHVVDWMEELDRAGRTPRTVVLSTFGDWTETPPQDEIQTNFERFRKSLSSLIDKGVVQSENGPVGLEAVTRLLHA